MVALLPNIRNAIDYGDEVKKALLSEGNIENAILSRPFRDEIGIAEDFGEGRVCCIQSCFCCD